MRINNFKKTMFFVLVALCTIAPVMSFALDYPHMDYYYNNVGEGSQWNYKIGDQGMLSATVTYDVSRDGELIGGGSNWDPAGRIKVYPGDILDIQYTVAFRTGFGNTSDGESPISDLLFVANDNLSNELGTYPPRVVNLDTWFTAIEALSLGKDQSFTLDVEYTVPISAGPGMIELPFTLFDYGFWSLARPSEDIQTMEIAPPSVWWFTRSVEGEIPLYVPDTLTLELYKEIVMLNDEEKEVNVIDQEDIMFEVTIEQGKEQETMRAAKLLLEDVLSFEGVYDLSTAEGVSMVHEYYGEPNFPPWHVIEETDIPEHFNFLRYEFEYHFGDLVIKPEPSYDLITELDLSLGQGIPDKVIVTVVNLYVPTPEPTPQPTPVPEPTEPENDDPVGPEEEPEVPTEPVPLALPVVEEATEKVVPEVLPLDVPVLPKTNEIPAALFYGMGSLFGSMGLVLRRRNR